MKHDKRRIFNYLQIRDTKVNSFSFFQNYPNIVLRENLIDRLKEKNTHHLAIGNWLATKFIHKLDMKSAWTDVSGTFCRKTIRKLNCLNHLPSFNTTKTWMLKIQMSQ